MTIEKSADDGWVLEIEDHPRQFRKDVIAKPIQLCATIAQNWEVDDDEDDETMVWSFTLRAGSHQYLIDTEHLAHHGPYATEAEAKAAAMRVADAYMREMYGAIRDRYEPVPVLRWRFDEDEPDGPEWSAELGQWVMAASADSWMIDTHHSKNPNPVADGKEEGPEANQRAAESRLEELGVRFVRERS